MLGELINNHTNLLQSTKTLCATSIRRIPAVMFQIPHGGGGRRVSAVSGHVERRRAAEGGNLVEPDAAEAQNGVARRVRLGYVYVAARQRALQRVHTLLRVVGHHGQLGAGRGSRRRHLKSRPGVSREEPGREHGAAPAPVEVAAARGADAAEELRRQVEVAGLGLGLDGEGGDRVVVAGFQGLRRLGE